MLLLLSLLLLTAAAARAGPPTSANCTELYYAQTLDHFDWLSAEADQVPSTFPQRYFVCDQFWQPGGPIFWYFGNEDDITLYVNHTGLMWENAASFGALLVFAEHRYYGQSVPFPAGTPKCMRFLTTEQALADYATLIGVVRAQYGALDNALVGFGGSYAYFRLKYPWLCDGVVSASAPIWAFAGLDPPYDSSAFYRTVTADASAAGGASDACKTNFRAAQPLMAQYGASAAGRARLAVLFRTCRPLDSPAAAAGLLAWAQDPWATMAMGNYPYPSSYLMHGASLLPAWPVRAACQPLDTPIDPATDPEALFAAVREAVAVYYNNTGDVSCFFNGPAAAATATDRGRAGARQTMRPRHHVRRVADAGACVGDWDWQWCTEMVQPFSSGLGDDMFWPPSPYSLNDSIAECRESWGVTPRPTWAALNLANTDLRSATNIVFSNGLLDPWHGGGVLVNQSDTVVAVVMPNGAHHNDLMFSDPADPPDVLAARQLEVAHMRAWIAQRAKTGCRT